MTIHIVPIEPIEERYSAQWLTWFTDYINHTTIGDYVIYDPSDYINTRQNFEIINGQFLDAVETSLYKSQQLTSLITAIKNKTIKSGDCILFFDGWFPGVESIAYIRDILNLDIRLIAMFHAGTYDPNDFLSQTQIKQWGPSVESSWLILYDKILVATHYHKNLILSKFKQNNMIDKIKVVFFPILNDWLPDQSPCLPEAYVVFPHRLAPEKQPKLFEQLQKHKSLMHHVCLMTKKTTNNKTDYWSILQRSTYSVSMALQETWGIAMIESVIAGCIPIVPNRLSYAELYPSIFKYPDAEPEHTVDAILQKLEQLKQIPSDEITTALENLRNKFLLLGSASISTILGHCHHEY